MAARGGGHHRGADRRVRIALLASGLRWRARSSIAMLAVALFACGAAAFGPIYLHSTDQLVLANTLEGAAPGNTGLTFTPTKGHPSPSALARLARSAPEPGGRTRWWGSPILTESAGFVTVPRILRPGAASASTAASVKPMAAGSPAIPVSGGPSTGLAHLPVSTGEPSKAILLRHPYPYSGTRPFVGSLVARSDECAHLHIIAGTCPKGDGVVVSTRTAQSLDLAVGGNLNIVFRLTTRVVPLYIVGVYTPGNPFAPYWWEENYFPFGTLATGTDLISIDDVFTTPAGVRAVAPPKRISNIAQLPYQRGTLTVDSVGPFESDLAAFQANLLHADRVRVSTQMFGLLGQAGSVEHSSATVVDVVDLELVLLGIFVLYFVASRTAAEREPDVRLSELRGFRPLSTIAVALAEPVVIVAAAVPVGLLGAWLVAGASAPAIFGTASGLSVPPFAAVAAIAAGIAGVAAAGLGARRSLASTVGTPEDAPVGSGRSRWSIVGDVVAVALAGAAFFELVVGGDSGSGPSGSDPLAALAPGLLAVALGVLAARLLPPVLGASHRRTAFSSKLAFAFATRTVARRREYAAQLVLTALAVALATFAVSGWVIANRNRDERAELGVGAAKVLKVSVQPGSTFLQAVRKADPTGRYAMAVAVEQAKDGTTLAVDAHRLPGIGIWPANLGTPASAIAHRLLATHLAPPVTLAGTAVSATLDVPADIQPAPLLSMEVYDIGSQFSSTVTLGPLQTGVHRYTGLLYGDCPGGCRLLNLSVTWAPSTAVEEATTHAPSVTIEVVSLEDETHGRWAPLHAGVDDPQRWTSSSGGVQLFRSGNALGARLTLNTFGSPVTIGPADVPKALPVVVTPTSASTASGYGGPLVVGLDGGTLPGHAVSEVPSLPGVGTDAVLANLQTAERFLTGNFGTVTTQVWLSGSAPASIVASLRSHGVDVVSTITAAGAVGRLAHSGLSLAYLLYLVAAVAAGLLMVGSTAFTLSSAARRRQGELAALRAVGLDQRSLRRAVRAEQALVLTAGAVVGLLAGTVAAAVALRSVPEFVLKTPGPPLELGLPTVDLLITVALLVAALVLTVLIGSALVVRGATVDRLAGGQT